MMIKVDKGCDSIKGHKEVQSYSCKRLTWSINFLFMDFFFLAVSNHFFLLKVMGLHGILW